MLAPPPFCVTQFARLFLVNPAVHQLCISRWPAVHARQWGALLGLGIEGRVMQCCRFGCLWTDHCTCSCNGPLPLSLTLFSTQHDAQSIIPKP